jgi:hypothetical protein
MKINKAILKKVTYFIIFFSAVLLYLNFEITHSDFEYKTIHCDTNKEVYYFARRWLDDIESNYIAISDEPFSIFDIDLIGNSNVIKFQGGDLFYIFEQDTLVLFNKLMKYEYIGQISNIRIEEYKRIPILKSKYPEIKEVLNMPKGYSENRN